jgi:hypothetical protein
MSRLVTCQRLLAVVRRDMAEATPVIIFIHEFQILQVIHGEGNVTAILDPKKYLNQVDVAGLEDKEIKDQLDSRLQLIHEDKIDPMAEYDRLVQRYGKHAEIDQPNVEYVYGRPSDPRWKAAVRMTLEDVADLTTSGEPETLEEEQEVDQPKRATKRRAEAVAA